MLKHRIFVLWSVSPVAKLAILFSTIQLHPCPQHQSPWRTLSCFQVYFFLVRLPVAVGLDDEYPLSFLIHCRQHPSSCLQRIPGSAYIQRLSLPVGLLVDSLSVFCNNHRSIGILYCSVSMVILPDIWFSQFLPTPLADRCTTFVFSRAVLYQFKSNILLDLFRVFKATDIPDFWYKTSYSY